MKFLHLLVVACAMKLRIGKAAAAWVQTQRGITTKRRRMWNMLTWWLEVNGRGGVRVVDGGEVKRFRSVACDPGDSPHHFSVLAMHGMCCDGQEYVSLANALRKKLQVELKQQIKAGHGIHPFRIRILAPIAQVRNLTIMGEEQHAWYNYYTDNSNKIPQTHDRIKVEQFKQAGEELHRLVMQEQTAIRLSIEKFYGHEVAKGTKFRDRVFVGGVSQGGTVALKVAMEHGTDVGAVFALRTLLMPEVKVNFASLQNLPPLVVYDAGRDYTYSHGLMGRELRKRLRLQPRSDGLWRPGKKEFLLVSSKKSKDKAVRSTKEKDMRAVCQKFLRELRGVMPLRGEVLWCKQFLLEHGGDSWQEFALVANILSKIMLNKIGMETDSASS